MRENHSVKPHLKLVSEQTNSLFILQKKSEDARFVAVEVTSIVLQSLEGTQTQLNITGDLSLDPLLLNSVAPDSAVCINVVLQVKSKASQSKLHRMAALPTCIKKEQTCAARQFVTPRKYAGMLFFIDKCDRYPVSWPREVVGGNEENPNLWKNSTFLVLYFIANA